ncbi:MAG: toll/interleukin-1 receptor domain-containing protein [Elusimicrobiales bacterium]|nr:toll/interleukin-1 receptor domain-containing protein [Elusimicrobiales bacterium]
MRVFISYSTPDLALVYKIAQYIKPYGDVFFWDKDKILGKESWPTIFSWIDQADLVLAVITEKTLTRAMPVGQEIGRAQKGGKLILTLVGPDVQSSELGFLNGITYQRIQLDNLGPALKNIERVILATKEKLEQRQAIFIVSAIALLLMSFESEK